MSWIFRVSPTRWTIKRIISFMKSVIYSTLDCGIPSVRILGFELLEVPKIFVKITNYQVDIVPAKFETIHPRYFNIISRGRQITVRSLNSRNSSPTTSPSWSLFHFEGPNHYLLFDYTVYNAALCLSQPMKLAIFKIL